MTSEQTLVKILDRIATETIQNKTEKEFLQKLKITISGGSSIVSIWKTGVSKLSETEQIFEEIKAEN